ncbi:pyridoxamine 5'-phosphate oxidase family protein [Halobaculum lipolyticum]|uniref:Pyridoxamine 5'-phosphate oxidase family protein n=1 Tax=Halobaculum lipolyticum TaxID=3032001 RepID=A0ABD5WIK8_9EURY|nr:pyridoxamine 5'-phosphate oxidase family protein [Halobaculum sp. DT31]
MSTLAPLRDRLDGLALSAHLATAVDDRPHVAPVWFVLDDEADALWLFTGGKKLRNVDRNPRVALSVESADRAGTVDWQATLLGTARRVDDPERAAWVEGRLAATYAMHEADPDALAGDDDSDGGTTASSEGLVRVDVGSVSVTDF